MSRRKKEVPGHFRVAGRRCATCIYGAKSPVKRKRQQGLEASTVKGDTFINCHTAVMAGTVVCCRGFWERQDTTPLQLARRLDAAGILAVEVVDMDELEKEAKGE